MRTADLPAPLLKFFQDVQPHKRECSLYKMLQCGCPTSSEGGWSGGPATSNSCACLPALFGVTEGDASGEEQMLLLEDLARHTSPAFAAGKFTGWLFCCLVYTHATPYILCVKFYLQVPNYSDR
jgi:hypothetical protein